MKPTIYAPFLSLVVAACNSLASPGTTLPPPPSFTAIRVRGDSRTVLDTLNKFRAGRWGRWTSRAGRSGEHLFPERPQRQPEPCCGHDCGGRQRHVGPERRGLAHRPIDQVPEIFRNSVVMSGANDSYTVTFRNPGTYTYNCAIHGAAMTGRIVVQ